MTAIAAKTRDKRRWAKVEIARYYKALQEAYGRQHWWPGRTRFEVILGTFLTQNTSWRNVELALRNLRRARALSIAAIRELPEAELANLIRPSGYFRQKAKRIKNFVAHVDAGGGSLAGFLNGAELAVVRERLLGLDGVGHETADSILLYAASRPTFVVDAYTRRVLERHGVINSGADYDEARLLVEEAFAGAKLPLARDKNLGHKPTPMSRAKRSTLAQHYNEFHGLLVQLGKRHCRKKNPECAGCPLERFLPLE
jgi:endonuclease-3 related protein